jgi:cyclopropane fatty-acyl-phospholipid synthase-like methyltransferase
MATDVGTAGLTDLYGEMTSVDRILRALTADGVDVERLQARDLYERDLDCQNLGASKMLQVIATAVAEHRVPEPADTVLDVGCGMGGPGRFLADRFGCSVLGVDLLALRVEAAQALTDRTGLADRVTYRVADARRLPVDDGAAAQVWMLDVGIHVHDKKALFAEVARALQPRGLFVMHDQTGPLPPAMRPATRRAPFIAPSLPQLLRYVEGAGLRVLRWQDSSARVVEHQRLMKAHLEQRTARTDDDERRRRYERFAAITDAYITTLAKLGGRTGILIAERTAAN